MSVLRELLQAFDNTFIVCDALDECIDRDKLLEDIEQMTSWTMPQLHLLATSRRERDIEDSLEEVVKAEATIRIQSSLINDDIEAYVENRIHTDSKLKRWRRPDLQQEIIAALSNKADGM